MPGGWIRCELQEKHKGNHSWERGYVTWEDETELKEDVDNFGQRHMQNTVGK